MVCNVSFIATDWSLVQRSPTVCLYVCDQETPKMEAKGPSWTTSACEWMNVSCIESEEIQYKLDKIGYISALYVPSWIKD
jgi:hypothetical protein